MKVRDSAVTFHKKILSVICAILIVLTSTGCISSTRTGDGWELSFQTPGWDDSDHYDYYDDYNDCDYDDVVSSVNVNTPDSVDTPISNETTNSTSPENTSKDDNNKPNNIGNYIKDQLTSKDNNESPDNTNNNNNTQNQKPNQNQNQNQKPNQSKEPIIPTFYNHKELRDFINENFEKGILEMTFYYKGSDKITGNTITDLISVFYYNYTYDNTSKYTLTLTDFVGNKIVRAYNSGDYSKLTNDEINTLNIAKSVVNTAKNNTRSKFELELYLHDYITAVTEYNYSGAAVPDPKNPPRHLTAVGALIDGSANCQGYADAFYLLCTLAGFEVSRISGLGKGEPHMINTIKLDGKWYVVDATFNDTTDTKHPETNSYMSFNIGRDLCTAYEWGELMEYHKIADTSDKNFYYFSDDACVSNGYQKYFYNMDMLAKELVSKWNDYGISDFHVALLGNHDITKFDSAVYDEASKLNKAFSYSFNYSDNTKDYFIHFTFN